MRISPDLRSTDAALGLRSKFDTASPFPHIVVENVLTGLASSLSAEFPDPQWEGWSRFEDRYEPGKMFCNDITAIPPALAEIIAELSQPAFLEFLEALTGIPNLLVDPYLEGGGLHCSGPGGVLVPHTDFHLHPRLGLYRRINVLVYFNEGWEESWGGSLELFAPGDADTPAKSVLPEWGNCVIFRTDDRSRHGFTQPVQEPHFRRSIALYYYTATEADTFSGDTATHWSRIPVNGPWERARQGAYRALISISRGFSVLAWLFDPGTDIRSKSTWRKISDLVRKKTRKWRSGRPGNVDD